MRFTLTGFAFLGMLFGFVFFVVMTFRSVLFSRVGALMRCFVAIFMEFFGLGFRFTLFFFVFFDVKIRAAGQCVGLCASLRLFVFRFHQPR